MSSLTDKEKIFHTILIVFAASLFQSSGTFARDTLISYSLSRNEIVLEPLSLFQDTSKLLTIKDIESGQYAFTLNYFRGITTDNALWYKFRLVDTANIKARWLLQVDFPPLQKVEFHYKDLDGLYVQSQYGTSFPVHEWEVKERMPVFYIPENRNDSTIYYLRVESETPILYDIKIWNENSFILWNKKVQLLLGGFYGIIVVMFIFNLFLYFSARELSCLFFILFLGSYGLLQSINDGVAYQFFWPNDMFMDADLFPIFLGAYYIFGTNFTKAFLNTKKTSFIINNMLNIGVILGLSIIITSYLFPVIQVQRAGIYFLGMFVLLQLSAGIISVSTGFKPARIYVAGLIPLLILINLELLFELRIISSHSFVYHGWQLSSFFQMLSISFGLGNRVKLLETEKRKAIEKVRHNIFRDLHDEIGNNLASIGMMSQRFLNSEIVPIECREKLSEITDTIFLTSDSLREIIWFNNPENYTTDNFVLHLKNITGRVLKDINFTFDIGQIDSLKMQPLKVQKNLYLMFKEILCNILKHANAENVLIEIKEIDKYLVFSIRDNGKGFNTFDSFDGMGLKNLKLRAQEIHSSLDILSNPESGTEIIIKVNRFHHNGRSAYQISKYYLKKINGSKKII